MANVRSSLAALFAPRTIAVVGASSNPAAIGGRPLHYAKAAEYRGKLYPVNPNRAEVQGFAAYPDIASIPEAIDLAIVAVPACDVVRAVEAAAAKGARAAVIFSAGFTETGDDAAQTTLRDVCRATGIRALGPNCLGLYNAPSRTVATFASCFQEGGLTEGPVGIVSQSGAYGSYLMLLAAGRGIGVGTWVTTGNEMDLTVADILIHMAGDPAVRVIGCVAEGISDGRAFLAALEATRAAGKPVVIMKMGRTSVGAEAARSHTASLAVDDAVFDAVVRQAGGYRVRTTQEMLDLLGALEARRPPGGDRLGIITMSGGVGVLMADAAADAGLILPPLSEAAQATLHAGNPLGTAVNPVDVTGQAMKNPALVGDALDAVLDGVDATALFLMNWLRSPDMGPPLAASIGHAMTGRDATLALVGSLPATMAADLRARGVLLFDDPDRAIATLGAMAAIGRMQARPATTAADLAAVPLADGSERDEVAAKRLVARIGLCTPPERLAASPGEAGAAAAAIGGDIALKIVSADLPHKSDIGGVRLDLQGADGTEAAARGMLARIVSERPDARLEGFLVSAMIRDGIEMIVATHVDPVFGPLVMAGFGGTLVEILRDVVFRYGAIDVAEARAMIGELAGFRLLQGVRGAPPADIDALAEAIAAVSRFGAANAGRIEGLEINPLLVRPAGKGCVVLDALVTPAG